MVELAGSVNRATIEGAWLRQQSIATRPSLADDFALGGCSIPYRSKGRMQCAQSNDKFGYASLRSEGLAGGAKMKARIAIHARTNACWIDILGCGAISEWMVTRDQRS